TESIRQHLVNVKHPALEMWDITLDSPELIEQDSAKASQPAAVAVEQPAVPDTTVKPSVTVLKTNGDKPAVEPEKPTALPSVPVQQIPVPTAATLGGDGVQQMFSAIQQLQQAAAACAPSGGTPQEQMAALQMSTAVSLMSAAANMMLMNTLALQQPQTAVASATPLAAPTVTSIPAEQSEAVSKSIEPVVEEPVAPVVGSIRPPQGCQTAALASPAPMVERVIESASIVLPTSFKVPAETYAIPIGTVTIGGSGTRTSAITIGGSTALPFRHFEGSVGNKQVVAMEVFDKLPRNYPEALKQVYADVLNDPAVMAKYLVNEIGADAISIRLESAHPDSGDTRPADAAKTVESILQAVGVPIIVTGPSHFEKNNAVMKEIAGAFPKENLLLNWTETDNYKTIAASAMGYNHCVVAQTPIDVNMAKQLNILMTNMGVSADKIVIDAMTGAIGYGLEYTYSVMERIRTSAFTGDAMLAFPMLGTPGFEVAKTKESKAPAADFPLWGPESERGALLEIATAMSLLNAGADMLILYHPIAAKTIKSKIDEMNAV
ncbi:MAG: acetyl-CoA decarbonylase/synthase complex subunit delta, partial [Armatimonadota bacterium]